MRLYRSDIFDRKPYRLAVFYTAESTTCSSSKKENQAVADFLEFLLEKFLRGSAHSNQDDHRGYSPNDAKHGQSRAQPVAPEAAPRLDYGFIDEHEKMASSKALASAAARKSIQTEL
jgi:hypothetical protein